MENDPPQVSRECLQTRDLFPRALEDPSVEEEILLHARGCLACMDAFLELQDTVKKLRAAALEIPDTSQFSRRVLDALDAPAPRAGRPARRPLLVAGGGVLAGIACTIALILAVSASRGPDAPAVEEEAADPRLQPAVAPVPAESAPPPQAPSPSSGEAQDPSASTVTTQADPVETLFQAILAAEREPPSSRPARPGARAFTARPLMMRAAMLDPADRARLIERLKDPAEAPRGLSARRFREEILERLNALSGKGIRRPGGR